MTEKTAWQFIRWNKVVHRVRSLQSRIVKAVKSGRWNLKKVLQGILSRSYSSKLLSIRRITENSGKRTAGIDGQKWDTPKAKYEAIGQLGIAGYKPLPVRRIKIPKANGKFRPPAVTTQNYQKARLPEKQSNCKLEVDLLEGIWNEEGFAFMVEKIILDEQWAKLFYLHPGLCVDSGEY